MNKRKRYAIASGAALLLTLGGGALLTGPAFADTGVAPTGGATTVQTQVGHEDGTNDGETADDANDPNEANEAPGTETADDANEANDPNEANEAPGTETADDANGQGDQAAGHEDGTNDGETADDAVAGK